MASAEDKKRDEVQQWSDPAWPFPDISLTPFSLPLQSQEESRDSAARKTCNVCKGLWLGTSEFGSCLPRNELRTLSSSLLPAVGCQQSYFTYPESNNYKGAIIFCHYYRVTAISWSRQPAEVFVHGLLHCPSPAFLHGSTLFEMLFKSSCQSQQCLTQPQHVRSFEATEKPSLLSPALFVAKCLLSD